MHVLEIEIPVDTVPRQTSSEVKDECLRTSSLDYATDGIVFAGSAGGNGVDEEMWTAALRGSSFTASDKDAPTELTDRFTLDSVSQSLSEALAARFFDIAEVEAVQAASGDYGLEVYVVVDDVDDDALDKIFDLEYALLGEYGDWDFHCTVVSRRGRPLKEVLGGMEFRRVRGG